MRTPIPVNTPVVHLPTGKQLVVLADDGESYVLCVVGGEALTIGHGEDARVWDPGERILLPPLSLARICEEDCPTCFGTGNVCERVSPERPIGPPNELVSKGGYGAEGSTRDADLTFYEVCFWRFTGPGLVLSSLPGVLRSLNSCGARFGFGQNGSRCAQSGSRLPRTKSDGGENRTARNPISSA